MKATLRPWQGSFVDALQRHRGDDFLLVACPAAGKTIGAIAGAAAVMAARDCDQLIVVAPTVVVRDQWVSELARFGFRIRTSLQRGGWPASDHGICITYAVAAQRPELYQRALEERRTVVICDEIHHAGGQRSWGAGLRAAFAGAQLRLMLSGTPFRSDGDEIPFVAYDSAGMSVADFSYDYARAVREGVCRSVEFRAHDGLITWRDDGAIRSASFVEQLDAQTEPRRLRASLDPSKPFLRALLQAAHHDLLTQRELVPDAAGLVVCDSQEHALAIDDLITKVTGSMPVLAISDMPGSHRAIRAFAGEDVAWMVSVRMVTEGVDIPRLGVIAWASATKTELMVRQVAGRALRSSPGDRRPPAVIHMPADPQLVGHAERIDQPGGVSVRRRPELGRSELDQRRHGASGPSGSRLTSAVDAVPGDCPPATIASAAAPVLERPPAARDVAVLAPALPPSPAEVAAAERGRAQAASELFRLVCVYADLRRSADPGYQLGSAHAELREVLPVTRPADATRAQLDRALAWIRSSTADFARRNPEHVRQVARARRRLAIA